MDRKLKHLEFIQNVVNRLSTNSFLLKGWTVVLVASLFVVANVSSRPEIVILAFLPSIVFWGLDGYFLWQERLFREVFDRVREKRPDDIDFNMSTKDVADNVPGLFCAIFSKTLIPFHGVLITATLVVWLSFRGT